MKFMLKSTFRIPEQKSPHFRMQAVTLTTDDLSTLRLSWKRDDFREFLTLGYANRLPLPTRFRKARRLFSLYPDSPEIMNLLAYLYIERKKIYKANRLIVTCYRSHPDYLIGKINFADYLIRKKKWRDVSEVFGGLCDLRLIAPNRETFTFSEYRGFMTVMSRLELERDNPEAAEGYFYLAYKIDRDHPSVERLKRRLLKSFLTRDRMNR